jgi:MOSC domain-containing protein YiiM
MKTVSSVLAEEGKGLVGDRYHGTRHRHVTVQSLESLAAASEALGQPIEPGMTRRNVTLDGGIVPSQSGKRIRIGPVELEVVRIAAPCRLLDDGIGPGAARALHQRAGSVCRVLRGGEIRVGDTMSTSAE